MGTNRPSDIEAAKSYVRPFIRETPYAYEYIAFNIFGRQVAVRIMERT